jgi:hypothetical protein
MSDGDRVVRRLGVGQVARWLGVGQVARWLGMVAGGRTGLRGGWEGCAVAESDGVVWRQISRWQIPRAGGDYGIARRQILWWQISHIR